MEKEKEERITLNKEGLFLKKCYQFWLIEKKRTKDLWTGST